MNKSKTLSSIITYILILLFLFVAIGICVYSVGGVDEVKSWVGATDNSNGIDKSDSSGDAITITLDCDGIVF